MSDLIISTHTTGKCIPWIEKYRPNNFEDIVLGNTNKMLFQNILDKNYFPNLLFYGPPGTGKTTTIINLINEHQTKYNRKNKSTIIHLNASDERGIDIIRNQINQFVKSRNLFEEGLKFVILDEVDYMTKNAQQALKYLLQTSTYNVRFCLICNYISKIDESLKNELICLRFNQLPKSNIILFIKKISDMESLHLDNLTLMAVQEMYDSDIRSMVNFIQLNQNVPPAEWLDNILTPAVFKYIHTLFAGPIKLSTSEIVKVLHDISIKYNIDKKTVLYKYFDYIIRNHKEFIVPEFINILQIIIHNSCNTIIIHTLEYACVALCEFYARVI